MLACIIQEKAFDYLDAPIRRVTSMDAPAIYSPPLEKEQLPTPQKIFDAALAVLK
jgi:pyruvate dehydrogenase E1 component beta subunit